MKRKDIDMLQLHLKDVKKSYKGNSFTIDIDELKINQGEFFGLLGPSGCGKTTLLKLIAGLIEPDSGTIEVNSKNMTMVFQQPLLFPHLSIEKNIEFGLKMSKVEKSKRKQLIHHYLSVVGLTNYNKRYPSELSGGQMQRVSIARAMVLKPQILLMDEPFSALDPSLREDMRKLIFRIHRDTKMTIVFVTHDIDEAFELFSRVAVLKEGRIIDIGSPEDIYKKPRNIDSAMFLKSSNIIELPFDELIHADQYTKVKGKKYKYAIIRPESFGLNKRETEQNKANNEILINECEFNNKSKVQRSAECIKTDKITALGTLESIKSKLGFIYYNVKIGNRTVEVVEKSDNQQSICVKDRVEVIYSKSDIHFIE